MNYRRKLSALAGAKSRYLFVTLALGTTALFSLQAFAGPEGGQVTVGSGAIDYNGPTTVINQASQNLAINWNSFNVGSHETVNFNQPNSSAIALNRVLGQDPSKILGNINANGQVFIVNPNGVLFGKGSQVNVGGIVASTHDLSDEKFIAGDYKFTNGEGRGAVVNQGTITAKDGGYVALLAPEARNEGVITARLGKAVLAAGDEVSLNLDNGTLVSYSVDKGSLNALAENKQLVAADGGHVYMTAKAADEIGKAVVNNTGIIEARTVENRGGKIVLGGGSGTTTKISGRVDASAASGKGGTIVATGEKVILENVKIDASGAQGGGNVLIGGGWQGKDSAIHNADTVIVQPDARIDVSAKDNGDGGTAVLWSEKFTGFAGEIDSYGGNNGGNGGKVETSSRGTLDVLGSVGTAAPMGNDGEWLLDPYNVFIEASGNSGTAYSENFVPTQNSTILASSIENSLSNGTNVTIQTGNSGASAGNIRVNTDITKTGNANATLTLQAAGNIYIDGIISSQPDYEYENYYGRLNIVLTANLSNGANGVYIGSTGGINTFNGNFIVGDGDIGSVTPTARDFVISSGGYVDVGRGNMDISVNNNIVIDENTLRAVNSEYYPQSYTNQGDGRYNTNNYISLKSTGGSITSTNTDATKADIITSAETRLQASNIGSSGNPVKISGTPDILGLISDPMYSYRTFPGVGRTLYVTNEAGNSYVNEINQQVFSTIDLTVGTQANSTHRVNVMGDQGGKGHVLLETNGSGVLELTSGDIDTSGVPGMNTGDWSTSTDPSVFATSVSISAPTILFGNDSVNTGESMSYFYYGAGSEQRYNGMTSYSATFSANASTVMRSNNYDGNADIRAVNAVFTGPEIGTSANRLEIANGSVLSVDNTGGNTFIDSVDDTFGTMFLTNVKTSGIHEIHFAGGDHIDYQSDGNNIYVPNISSPGCVTTSICSIDVTRGDRNINLIANSGNFIFADYSIDTGAGEFSATISNANNEGSILAESDYNSSAPAPQITASNITFNVYSSSAPGTIGGGNKHIQVAQGSGASNNTLTVNTMQGNVNIHELTTNHFKTLNTTLNNSHAAQTIMYDLAGSDDVLFSDDGSTVLIDADKVNLSSNNRNWYLTTNSRTIQADGNSLDSGSYTLNASLIRLNGDIVTNGGSVSLTGNSGIRLMRSARIDTNSDDIGPASSIYLSGMLSGVGAGYNFVADASSSNSSGSSISMYSGANDGGGHYLNDFTLTSAGAAVNGSQDGGIYFNHPNYFIKGNFSSRGLNYLQTGVTIDTEQGNTGNGGNISFSGRDLSAYYWSAPTFNTSTTAAGMNGGNVDLYGTFVHSALNTVGITVNTAGGAGGTAGDINLPSVMTTRNGYSNNQSYTGGVITLNGNLTTDKGSVVLNGDTRLATDIIIDTWAATNGQQNGTAGSVTISGIGVSGNAAGRSLTIDTSSAPSGYYTGTTPWNQSGGNISIIAGNSGGYYLNAIWANANSGGGWGYNTGLFGTISLGNVGTVGEQAYAGGVLTLNNGAVTTNGGNVDLRYVSGVTVAGTSSIDTDRLGGTGNAGTLDLGSNTLNGAGTLTIDLTADGGGTSQDLTLDSVGSGTPLAALTAIGRNVTVTGTGVTAAGDVTIEARGATSDLTLDSGAPVRTTNGLITLTAGRDFINNNAANTGIVKGSGRYLVYSAHPDDTTEGMTGYSKHYNQTYTAGSVPSYASANDWFLYAVAPTLTVTPGSLTLPYNQTFGTTTYLVDGTLIDGDIDADISGAAIFTASGSGPGVYDIAYASGLLSSLGYVFVDDTASIAELTIQSNPAISPIPGANEIIKLPNGPQLAPIYTAALNSVSTPENVVSPAGGAPSEQTIVNQGNPNKPVRVGNSTDLQIGTVIVKNGGIKLPDDANADTSGASSDEDERFE